MTAPNRPGREDDDDVIRLNILGTIESQWRRLLLAAGAIAAIVAFAAAIYLYWGQPKVRTVTLEFRPAFSSAAEGQYPNGLAFATSDITAPSVIDAVYQTNELEAHCSAEAVGSSLFVEQRSSELQFLEAEFRARLGNAALSAVERDQLLDEYRARRASLPLQYRLAFVVPEACDSMPDVLAAKVLTDVLETWAEQSETQRGVLKLQVQILSPGVLDVGLENARARLIRADLIRTGLRRLVDNVRAAEELPGAALVRLGSTRVTFAEIRTKLEDLMHSRLEPMVVSAGRGLGNDSLVWVEQSLASAQMEQRSAEGRAKAYLDALREYSGLSQSPEAPANPQAGSGSDVQSLAPQIDRTFIDRIIEMSSQNIAFRQDLTKLMVEADVTAVASRAKVEYYQHLDDALRRTASESLTPAEVDAQLAAVIDEGKKLAGQFNDLYDELSRVALRPSSGLFRLEGPVATSTYRPFTRRNYVVTVLVSFLLALVLTLVVLVVRDRIGVIRAARPA